MRNILRGSVVVLLLLVGLTPAPAGAQGTLYSISANFTFDASNHPVTFLRRLDPATGQTLSSIPITMVNPPPPLMPGDPRNTFVLSGNGLAVHPVTHQLFGILTVESEADANIAKRHLATIDPNTGMATLIGDIGTLAGLAFTTGGALGAGTLLGVSGHGPGTGRGGPPCQLECPRATLYQLSTADATGTLLKTLTDSDAGEAIAFDPLDLRLYHTAGSSQLVFESIDLGALGSPPTPITMTGFRDPNQPEITALMYAQAFFLAADLAGNFLSISPTGVVTKVGTLDHTSKGLAVIPGAPPPLTTLVAAVLPSSRSVQVVNTATAFATIINTGPNTAFAVGIALASGIPASFKYNRTDCATNAVIGADNAPVDIAAGGQACYVISITPTATFPPTEVQFSFAGTNTAPVAVLIAINTLLMSASAVPVPDIVALAATATNDGILHIPGAAGVGAFAVATSNVGISAVITASANTGATALPLALAICQTDPVTGLCISVIGPSVTVPINAGATPTFAIFATASGTIVLDPAMNRIFVVFADGIVIRGRTSVAVTTQ
jgi:hypothetical protein